MNGVSTGIGHQDVEVRIPAEKFTSGGNKADGAIDGLLDDLSKVSKGGLKPLFINLEKSLKIMCPCPAKYSFFRLAALVSRLEAGLTISSEPDDEQQMSELQVFATTRDGAIESIRDRKRYCRIRLP